MISALSALNGTSVSALNGGTLQASAASRRVSGTGTESSSGTATSASVAQSSAAASVVYTSPLVQIDPQTGILFFLYRNQTTGAEISESPGQAARSAQAYQAAQDLLKSRSQSS